MCSSSSISRAAGLTLPRSSERAMDATNGPERDHGGRGALRHCRYLLHDRDTKYSAAFRAIIETGHVRTLSLPARHYHTERNHQESPTPCCSLMPQRCAAQDRCDAASGWVDPLLPSRGRVNPRATSAEGECCTWPSTPSYMLFVTITDGKLMSGGGCPRPALGAIVSTVLRSFRFFGHTGAACRL
jgi:hypothetical protein